jgi:hypothetical protein
MVWFFDRQGQRLRYEIRYGGTGAASYEIAVTYPDGRTQVEAVQDAVDLLRRCADIVRALKDEGWQTER